MKILESHESGEVFVRNGGKLYVCDEDGNWFKPRRWKYTERQSIFAGREDSLERCFQAMEEFQSD